MAMHVLGSSGFTEINFPFKVIFFFRSILYIKLPGALPSSFFKYLSKRCPASFSLILNSRITFSFYFFLWILRIVFFFLAPVFCWLFPDAVIFLRLPDVTVRLSFFTLFLLWKLSLSFFEI